VEPEDGCANHRLLLQLPTGMPLCLSGACIRVCWCTGIEPVVFLCFSALCNHGSAAAEVPRERLGSEEMIMDVFIASLQDLDGFK